MFVRLLKASSSAFDRSDPIFLLEKPQAEHFRGAIRFCLGTRSDFLQLRAANIVRARPRSEQRPVSWGNDLYPAMKPMDCIDRKACYMSVACKFAGASGLSAVTFEASPQ